MAKLSKIQTQSLLYRLRAYGLTVEQFHQMWSDQGGRCGICKIALAVTKRVPGTATPCIDHCHRTQSVRGLLCRDCNWGLGHFKDDPTRLGTAIDYLAKPPFSTRQAHLELDPEAESLWLAANDRRLLASERRKALVFMWHARQSDKPTLGWTAKRFQVSEVVIRADLKSLGLSSMASWPSLKASLPYAWRDETYDENAA